MTRRMAYRVVGSQALFTFVVAALWLLQDTQASFSALVGGACCIVPNFLYAFWLFRRIEARAVNKILLVFYGGEFAKLLLAGALVIIAIVALKVVLVPFFVGFIVAQLSVLVAPFLMK